MKEAVVIALGKETEIGHFHHIRLGKENDYVVVRSLSAAHDEIKERPYDVLIIETDLIPCRNRRPLPSEFSALVERQPNLKILLIISRDSHREFAVRLLKQGAFDAVKFPFYKTELRKMLGRAILVNSLQKQLNSFLKTRERKQHPSETLGKDQITAALQKNNGIIWMTAKELGISLAQFSKLMKKFGLKSNRARGQEIRARNARAALDEMYHKGKGMKEAGQPLA